MSKNLSISIRQYVKTHVTDITAFGGLLICILIFSVVPPFFGQSLWTSSKLGTLMSDVIVIALMAVGAVFVYALGNMEISVGKQVGLYATLMVILGNTTGSLLPGILLSLAIAVVIAVINGVAGDLLKIHPIIPSLVFMMVLSGVSSINYNNLGSRSVSLKTIDYAVFKNPWVMLATLVVVTIIVTYLFNYTKLGKFAKAIGANEGAAQQCGINLIRYKIVSYIILAMGVVIASVFQMGYTGSASDSTGTGFEMNVMVVLILGGMPLSGGMRSKVSRAVVGAFTFSLLDVGLPLIGVAPNQTFMIKALIFIVVVLITSRRPRGVLPR